MSQDVYDVIIVGAGPAGFSAAAHAHVCGMSYLLLDQRRLANTFDYYYLHGEFVMTLPALIPLRSDMPFAAGSRDEVLRTWKTRALEYQLRHSHESVQKITKKPPEGRFAVETAQRVYTATHVVIAIGKKGNPNRLGVPGEELLHVADRLEDPGAYTGASILVVGGSDAAAETALALSERNHVTLSYRQEEFRPDKMNETLRGRLQEKIARGEIQAVFNSEVQCIDPEIVVLKDPQGTRRVRAEHVFLMLGASVPTHFLQRCGVTFSSGPSLDKQAVPRMDEQYQAIGVEGLYLIGSLTGKDLIKPAMNQGWEVIEYIGKRPVEPIDNALLSARLRLIPGGSVEAQLATIQLQVPLWRDTPLPQLRELLLLSTVRYVHPGERLFDKGHYSTAFFTIVEGGVAIEAASGQTVQRGVATVPPIAPIGSFLWCLPPRPSRNFGNGWGSDCVVRRVRTARCCGGGAAGRS